MKTNKINKSLGFLYPFRFSKQKGIGDVIVACHLPCSALKIVTQTRRGDQVEYEEVFLTTELSRGSMPEGNFL
jgi:hypothetical protein